MSKFIRLLIVAYALLLCHEISFSQSGSADDDVAWLINIPTPHTLSRGQIELDVLGHYTNYRLPDPRTEVADFVVLGHYGVTDNLVLSMSVPYSWISGNPNNFGIGDFGLSLKYQLLKTGQFQLALTPILRFPTGDKDNFRGSGKLDAQLELYLSVQRNRFGFFTNLGYGKSGYIEPQVVVGGVEGTVRNTEIFKFSGGLTYSLKSWFVFVIEGVGQTIFEFSDQDFFFQIGGMATIKNALLLKASAGMGFPRDSRTITDSRFTLGFSYLIN